MKQTIFSFLLTVCVGLISFSSFAQERLPDLSLSNLDGEKINISEYGENGKITIFSFWATWCAPCKKELSNIAEMYEDWKEAYNVEIIAVNVDDQRNVAKVKPIVSGKRWEYEVLLDPNEDLKRALNFQSIPHTIVVDSEGDIMYEHSGYVEGDEYELEDFLKEITEE